MAGKRLAADEHVEELPVAAELAARQAEQQLVGGVLFGLKPAHLLDEVHKTIPPVGHHQRPSGIDGVAVVLRLGQVLDARLGRTRSRAGVLIRRVGDGEDVPAAGTEDALHLGEGGRGSQHVFENVLRDD